MTIEFELQQPELLAQSVELDAIPSVLDLLAEHLNLTKPYEFSIRLVDDTESAELNSQYRNKQGPTNVLSFPYEEMPGVETDLLGDLVICAPLVIAQAEEQAKSVQMHFTHLVIHGTLHLLGYDHESQQEAQDMEQIEIKLMLKAGFKDPYVAIDPN